MSPFAGFKDFDACVIAQKKDGKTDESAQKICGAIKARVEGTSEATKLTEGEEKVVVTRIEKFNKFKNFQDEADVVGKELGIGKKDVVPKKAETVVPFPFLVCPTAGCEHVEHNKENIAPGDKECPKCKAKLIGSEIAQVIKVMKKFGETTIIDNVEIFKVGTWNGDPYSRSDLQAIVANFESLKEKVQPPMKLGHDEKQRLLKKEGLPAGGWIKKLKLVGDSVFATIGDVPKRLAQLIRDKQYKRVSAEIYPEYESDGKKYKNVLRAVALLGGDIPAIDSLKDVELLYTRYGEDKQGVKTYDIDVKIPIKKKAGEKKMKASTKKIVDLVMKKFQDAAPVGDAIGGVSDTEGLGSKPVSEVKEELKTAVVEKVAEAVSAAVEEVAAETNLQEGAVAGDGGDKDQIIADLKTRIAELEAQLRDKGKEVTTAAEKLTNFQKDQKGKDIKVFADKLVADGKLIPAKREMIEEMLRNADGTKVVKKFTEKDKDGKEVEVPATQYDMIKRFAAAQPEWVKFAEVSRDGEIVGIKTEITGPDGTKYPVEGAEIDLKAKKYMQDNKDVSYEEALVEVSKT